MVGFSPDQASIGVVPDKKVDGQWLSVWAAHTIASAHQWFGAPLQSRVVLAMVVMSLSWASARPFC